MTRIIVILLVLFALSSVWAQEGGRQSDLHDLLTSKKLVTCIEYEHNVSVLLPRFLDSGEIDSLSMILEFWEEECGPRNVVRAIKDLLAFLDYEPGFYPTETEMESRLINFIRMYDAYRLTYGYFELVPGPASPAMSALDLLIYELAVKAADRFSPTSHEYLLCLIYQQSYRQFFDVIKSPEFRGTPIHEAYLERIAYIHRAYGAAYRHYSFHSGVWIPDGRNEVLGNHMALGGSYGYVVQDIQWDLTMGIRFLKARNDYIVIHDGQTKTTNTFQELYIGLDIGHRLAGVGSLDLDLLGGLGWDGLTAIYRADGQSPKWLGTLNLNAGLRLKAYLNQFKTSYLALETRYHRLDWKNDGGTDLSGNAVTVVLTLGFYPKSGYRERLESMSYSPH